MEKKSEKSSMQKYVGWILFLLLLAFVIGIVFGPRLVHGLASWPLDKNSTCNFFNVSETDCDSFWCNNFTSNNTSNCSYDFNLSICNCTEIIINNSNNSTTNQTNTTIIYVNNSNGTNQTIIYIYLNSTNQTNGNLTNQTIQANNSYNCSDPNITFLNWQAYCNKTINCSDMNISMWDYNYYCNNLSLQNLTDLSGINLTLIQLKNSLLDYIDNRSNFAYGNSSYQYIPPEPWPWYAFAFIAAITAGCLIFITVYPYYKKIVKKKASPYKREFDNSKFKPESDKEAEKIQVKEEIKENNPEDDLN